MSQVGPTGPPLVEPGPGWRSIKWSTVPAGAIAAWVAEMDFRVAPAVLAAVRAAVDASDLGYPPWDDDELAGEVADWYTQDFGWRFSADHVLLMPDVMHAIRLAIDLWSAHGEPVVTTTPVYHPFLEAIAEMGRQVAEAPLASSGGRHVLDRDAVRAGLAAGARVVLLANPHNPTGAVFGAEELRALGDLVVEHDAWLVSDEIHAPLVFPGRVHVPVASLSPAIAARTLTITSVSKGWNVPGLNTASAIAGGTSMLEQFRALPESARVGASPLGIHASLAALRHGGPWLAQVMAVLDVNRSRLSDLFAEQLPQVRYRVPEATYLAWVDCSALGLPDDARPVDWFRDRAGVWLSDGATFDVHGRGNQFVRLNFATSTDRLDEVVRRMGASLPR